MDWIRWSQGQGEKWTRPWLCCWDVRCSDPPSQSCSLRQSAPRKRPESSGKILSCLCTGQEVRALLARRRTSSAHQRGSVSPSLARAIFHPSRGVCVFFSPDEIPSFQTRGILILGKHLLPELCVRRVLPVGSAGAALGQRCPDKRRHWPVFHLRPCSFLSREPVCTWFWFWNFYGETQLVKV